MAKDGARIHAMKMGVWRASRCHEHGMDRQRPPRDGPAHPIPAGPVTIPKRCFMKTSVLAALLLAAAILPAAAQSGPTPQEQMACRGDAGKFCAEHIGKPPQMNACLRENKTKLSDACRKVVESHGG